MAILAYTGLPGSGKSYSVVKRVILPALEEGRRVWTNIPINIKKLDPEKASRLTLFNISDPLENSAWFQEVFQQGATLVIDECWRLWPSGLKSNNMAEKHKSFLAEHRHMVGEDNQSTEIVIVVQDLANICAFTRNLVDKTHRTTKLSAIGASNRFRMDVYEGAVTGNRPPEKSRLRQIPDKYEREIYQYYKSQTMSEGTDHGDESVTDDSANILKSPVFRIVMPVVAVICVFIIWKGIGALNRMFGGEPEVQQISDSKNHPRGSNIDSAPQLPPPRPKYRHFYDGKKLYIAWNMGRSPYVEYKLGVTDGSNTVILDERSIGKMGYRIIGFDQCYALLEGHGDKQHVYCQSQKEKESQSIIDF